MNFLKKLFVLILFTQIMSSVFAETKKMGEYVVSLKASKPNAIYKIGDTAEFVLTVTKNGKAFSGANIEYLISKDGVAPYIKGSKNIGSVAKFEASLKEAGFIKCNVNVSFPDAKGKLSMLAGAGFNPLDIKPSLPVPDDFVAYWNVQKEILKKIPLNINMQLRNDVLVSEKKVPADVINAIDMYIVKADTFNGKLDAYLTKPKGAKPKSLPAIILPHGAGVKLSRYAGNFGAASWAKRGFLAIDFNVLGLDSDAKDQLQNFIKTYRGYPQKNADNRDTNFFRTMYLRLCRAMDVAMAQPEWDGKTLVVFGTSQGGAQALGAGGLYNDKVTMVCSFVPAICDQTGFMVKRINGWPHYIRPNKDGVYENPNMKLAEAIRYIDAMNFSSMIKAPTIFVVDLADPTCEPTSCFAAYSNISAPKTLITNPEARHSVPAECYNKVIEQVVEHAKQMKNK
ncbi:MAG: acetylxylan esterase [Verrucomicrobiaceae bacterium]|nr:acetylxylan esterase [Verrucomicrobiaceae bacterium]